MKTRVRSREGGPVTPKRDVWKRVGGPVTPKLNDPRSEGGFTLVEVMIALAILGTTAMVVLERRTEVVREAARSRDRRTLFVLASRKIAELELDKTLWVSTGGAASGDFGEESSDYAGFTWEALIVRMPVDLALPGQLPEPGKKPPEIFRLGLVLKAPSIDEPVLLEAQFPVPEPPQAPEPPPAGGGNP